MKEDIIALIKRPGITILHFEVCVMVIMHIDYSALRWLDQWTRLLGVTGRYFAIRQGVAAVK